ncbi:hypothetical protein TNCV_1475321 [Trichonephila clavipes]|nr:hypothetical protein TNCV_1475321 [Trichonephila clavipes]
MGGVDDLPRTAQRAYRGKEHFDSIQMVSRDVPQWTWWSIPQFVLLSGGFESCVLENPPYKSVEAQSTLIHVVRKFGERDASSDVTLVT